MIDSLHKDFINQIGMVFGFVIGSLEFELEFFQLFFLLTQFSEKALFCDVFQSCIVSFSDRLKELRHLAREEFS